VRIVLEGFRGEIGISALCRREGIHPTVYYAWLKDFMEAGKARLQADTARDATWAIENEARELDVQYLLGHSTPAMVRRYSATYDAEKAARAHERFSPADRMGERLG
jgi:transposase-like protein